MPAPEYPNATGNPLKTDSVKADLGFGDGGVPLPLLLFYLAFLVWFTWYTLEYQLPDFQRQGPVHVEDTGAEGASAPVK